MKKIVVLTGAGLDKESGIETFRDSKDGLWQNVRVEDVATPAAFYKNPGMVLDFYNQRRRQLANVEPNQAHKDLVKLEEFYDVFHITQNVSDLLERAGASNVLHLHGSLTESKSSLPSSEVFNIEYNDINIGDLCENGSQMRPNIVWFGEDVPNIYKAKEIAKDADIFIIIGTSLEVSPAAELYKLAKRSIIYVIDPVKPRVYMRKGIVNYIQETATVGVAQLIKELLKGE